MKIKICIPFLILFFFVSSFVFAQKGRNGNLTISTSTVVNTYTAITAPLTAGTKVLNVVNNLGLTQGDLVMIIQMQGALIKGNIENNTWGTILDYKNSGNYEFKEVASVGTGVINLSCALEKNYDYQITVTGGGNSATAYAGTQVIKMPRYNVLTIAGTGVLTAIAWNGKTGGIVAVEANSIIVDGTVDVSNLGFRGGKDIDVSGPSTDVTNINYGLMDPYSGATKGESIAGGGSYNASVTIHVNTCTFLGNKCMNLSGPGGSAVMSLTDLYKYVAWYKTKSPAPTKAQIIAWACPPASNLLAGMDAICTEFVDSIIKYATIPAAAIDYTYYVYGEYGRGAPANGGGGASNHNSGGGGGSNAGIGTWTGIGVPNPAFTANPTNAWSLDAEISGISPGGGRGGYSWGGKTVNSDPYVVPLGNSVWDGNYRRIVGGLGGRQLDYSTGKIFMGGGGGHGDNNEECGTTPGNGGGLIYLLTYGNVSGGGTIIANGGDGGVQAVAPTCLYGNDGVSGGGGGGTVIVNTTGTVSVSIGANGGKGSNQQIGSRPKPGFPFECEGPGGGGGGGYIAITNGTPARIANGGANGTTDQAGLVGQKFPPNGATSGANGIANATIALAVVNSCGFNISLIATPASICSGKTSSLSVTVSGGTTPYVYQWDHGLPATAGPQSVTLTTTTTYHVTVTEHGGQSAVDSVVVTVETPTLNSFPDTCQSVTSFALYGGGPAGGTYKVDGTTATTFNPSTASVGVHTITYTSSAGCSATQNITVKAAPTPNILGTTTICQGDNTTLTASGGGTYKWSDNSTNADITVTPAHDSTFTVTVTKNSCTATKTHTITITNKLHPIITTSNTTSSVCMGDSILLTVSSASTYKWSTGEISQQINTHALNKDSIYTVTVYGSGIGCSGDTSIIITINPSPKAKINGVDTICDGQTAVLTASAGNTYSWSTSETTATINVQPLIPKTYYLTVYSVFQCSDSTHHLITIKPHPNPFVNVSDQNICSGSSSTITAGGGTSYSWSNSKTDDIITVSPTTIGANTYIVTVTKANCSTNDTIIINVLPPPDNPQISGISLCSNDPPQDEILKISQPTAHYVYRWYDALTAGTELAQGTFYLVKQVSAPHTYYIETISSDSCHSSTRQAVSITMYNPPVVQFDYQPKPIVIQNAPVQMINQSTSTDGMHFEWMFGKNQQSSNVENPYYNYSDTGLFTITLIATTDHNCQAMDSMNIYVKARLFLWLPEVFTPNNDGKNDVFYVRGPVKTMTLEIYNQWGFRVFISNKQEDGWDGKFQGVEQPEGNYAWTLEATTTDELPVKLQGLLMLIR